MVHPGLSHWVLPNYMDLIFEVFNNQAFKREKVQILDLFTCISGLASAYGILRGLSFLLLRSLLLFWLGYYLRDIYVGVGRIHVEGLREDYTLRRRVNSFCWLWLLRLLLGTCRGSGSWPDKLLDFRARKVFKNAF